MKVYMLTWDNGYDYSDNEQYTIAIFDDYDKACEFCINKGYKKTETKGYFEGKETKSIYQESESIIISEIEMNKENILRVLLNDVY